jgi:hypothetical protein
MGKIEIERAERRGKGAKSEKEEGRTLGSCWV